MPANLNALIRYKTINDLLSARRYGCTIDHLVDACSEALAEFTGNYSGISERTVRGDLQVMKGDKLGFNAPIVFKNGKYLYSNPHYSLKNILISDHDLAQKIFLLFEKYLDRLEDPEAEKILKRLKDKIDRMKRLSEIEYFEDALESNIPGMMTFKVSEKAKVTKEIMVGDIFSLITSLKPKSN